MMLLLFALASTLLISLPFSASATGNVTDAALNDVIDRMIQSDVYLQTTGKIELNFQEKTSSGSKVDQADHGLFKRVSADLLKTDTASTLIALFNNYNRSVGIPEINTPEETREVDRFLAALMKTDLMKIMENFLSENDYLKPDQSFSKLLRSIWFTNYSRRNGKQDTSAFEHVFVGEYKRGKVSGLHNWLRLYLLEKQGMIDYQGFVVKKKIKTDGSHLFALIRYKWDGDSKPQGSFLLGTSPEFDLGIYSLCYILCPGRPCRFNIHGLPIKVITHSLVQNGKTYLGTAYPTAPKTQKPKPKKAKPEKNSKVRVSDSSVKNIVANLAEKDSQIWQKVNLNFQSSTSSRSTKDMAPQPLFTSVSREIQRTKTAKRLIALFDHCTGNSSILENIEEVEIDHFLHVIAETEVMKVLDIYLKSNDLLSNESSIPPLLKSIWFTGYLNKKGNKITTAFDHIFAGELAAGKVFGLHSWIRFYMLEQQGKVDYQGIIKKDEPLKGQSNRFALIRYTWEGIQKPLGSFLMGVSPELDFAIYTICFLARRGQECRIELAGRPLTIVTRTLVRNGTNHLDSAWPSTADSGPSTAISTNEVRETIEKMIQADKFINMDGKFTLNFQERTSSKAREDEAPERLFKNVSSEILEAPTVTSLTSLFNNYYREVGKVENNTITEKTEVAEFLHNVLETNVMKTLEEFMKEKKMLSDKSLKDMLKILWFTNYSRKKGLKDSSAFEHIFVGEYKKGKVSGFHNWIRLYLLEKDGLIDYHGFIMKEDALDQKSQDDPKFALIRFKWLDDHKPMGSFLLGTSPELDLAVYSLCFWARAGKSCKFDLNGLQVNIVTHGLVQDGVKYLGTAYPTVSKKN